MGANMNEKLREPTVSASRAASRCEGRDTFTTQLTGKHDSGVADALVGGCRDSVTSPSPAGSATAPLSDVGAGANLGASLRGNRWRLPAGLTEAELFAAYGAGAVGS